MSAVVSVVMSVYNGERFLRETIESVLEQTFQDWELIVVDDASTDSTLGILAEYRDPRIRVLRNATNRKQAVCSNRGIAIASGRYIARLDADDISLPSRLADQIGYLDAHPELTMVASVVDLISEEGVRVGSRGSRVNGCTTNFLFTWTCPVVHSSAVFRTEAARPPNGYDESREYWFTEDYEFMSRIAFYGGVRVLPERLVQYRVHPSSVSATNAREQLSQLDAVARANLGRATGLEIDDLCWNAWRRFLLTRPGDAVRFDSRDVGCLTLLIPALLRGIKHDSDGACVMPWYWAKHALALAVGRRGEISVVARARFLVLAAMIAVEKIIWH